ncbi:MAG TPA: hypothetical protein VEK14_00720, partial [Rhodomicrobium sp.]|nr:hypothetical protein [Rhodomicrobium sp.]
NMVNKHGKDQTTPQAEITRLRLIAVHNVAVDRDTQWATILSFSHGAVVCFGSSLHGWARLAQREHR